MRIFPQLWSLWQIHVAPVLGCCLKTFKMHHYLYYTAYDFNSLYKTWCVGSMCYLWVSVCHIIYLFQKDTLPRTAPWNPWLVTCAYCCSLLCEVVKMYLYPLWLFDFWLYYQNNWSFWYKLENVQSHGNLRCKSVILHYIWA